MLAATTPEPHHGADRAPRVLLRDRSGVSPPRAARRAIWPAAAALLIAGMVAAPVLDRERSWRNSAFELLDRAALAAGFGISRVSVNGHRLASERDILRALALAPGETQLGLDEAAALRRIEALPWVRRAAIRRALPDGIAIEVAERTPFALWRRDDRDVLIDDEGRELAAVTRGSEVGLPVVLGAGAGPAAPLLLAMVAEHASVRRRLVEAHRIDDRRWTLLLAGATLVHLPADGAAAALAWLEAQAADLLDSPLSAIDLRVQGQLVVRRREAQAREPGPASGRRRAAPAPARAD